MRLRSYLVGLAVIASSFIAVNPVEAQSRNGWEYVGTNKVGTKSYIRVLGRKGDLVKYENKLIMSDASGINDLVVLMGDCKTWGVKMIRSLKNGKEVKTEDGVAMNTWIDIMSGWAFNDDLNAACF